jgi:hypothetical protein
MVSATELVRNRSAVQAVGADRYPPIVRLQRSFSWNAALHHGGTQPSFCALDRAFTEVPPSDAALTSLSCGLAKVWHPFANIALPFLAMSKASD